MRSRALLRRLEKIKLPTLLPDWTALNPLCQSQFWEISLALTNGAEVSQSDRQRLRYLISLCPLVDKDTHRYLSTKIDPVDDQDLKYAFGLVLRKIAQQDRNLVVPALQNRLSFYRRATGYYLLMRYGWVPGVRDCSSMVPLKDWDEVGRRDLIELLQRAQPEDWEFPPGWECKFDPRAPFI